MSTSWTKNIFLYYDDDDAWDGTCDHLKTNEAKRTLALLFQCPWEGRQATRSLKEPNVIVKDPCLLTKSKKRNKKKMKRKKKRKTLGRLGNLIKHLKKGINKRTWSSFITSQLVEFFVSHLCTFALGLAHFCGGGFWHLVLNY